MLSKHRASKLICRAVPGAAYGATGRSRNKQIGQMVECPVKGAPEGRGHPRVCPARWCSVKGAPHIR
jgi:hypothetical protein